MILQLLCKNQEKWESMAKAMGCPDHLIHDVVQDVYLKIVEMKNPQKILYGEDDVNHFYVYLTIRSVFLSVLQEEKRSTSIPRVELSLYLEHDPVDMEKEEAWERLWCKISSQIDTFGRYGSKLTNSYFKSDRSMRQMAEESGISLTSIFNSIKKYKAYLQEEFSEDYEDYINRDFDKI